MEDKKSAVSNEDLEIVEIAEFKRGSVHRKIAKHEQRERRKRHRFYGILALYAMGFLAVILLGIFIFHLPAVQVCVVLALESVIAACLYDVKNWIQILVFAIGIAAGIVFGRLFLMLLGAAVYLGAVLALYCMKRVLSD